MGIREEWREGRGRRERDGEMEEGRAEGKCNQRKGEGERRRKRDADGALQGARAAGGRRPARWAPGPAAGAWGPAGRRPAGGRGEAARGPAVHAKGARRRARAHLYFAAGSRQPRPGAGLALAPPLGHRGLVDWPPEKQARFPPPLSCWSPGRTLQARRRVEGARGLGRGKGPPGPLALTPDSPRCLERRRVEPG